MFCIDVILLSCISENWFCSFFWKHISQWGRCWRRVLLMLMGRQVTGIAYLQSRIYALDIFNMRDKVVRVDTPGTNLWLLRLILGKSGYAMWQVRMSFFQPKLKLFWKSPDYSCLQLKECYTLQILKVSYLSHHCLDLSQTWNFSSGDQTEI